MDVKTYVAGGLAHRVETPPEGYVALGEAREGGHRVAFYARVENGALAHVVFTSTKRCKKLMALADRVCTLLEGQTAGEFTIDPDAVLGFFQDERDQEKLRKRMDLILRALHRDEGRNG